MKKAGIMGGTFNPIHLGHLIAAEEVREKLDLDYVVFLPSGNPPHKLESDVLEGRDRYEMVKLAVDDNDYFRTSDLEIRRTGKTYTYDTLKELGISYKDVEFYFLIGFDTLRDMETWKNIREVFKMTTFVVVNRGNLREEMREEIARKISLYNAKILVVDMPNIDVSSTDIRARVSRGKSIRYLVPHRVYEYIMNRGLYRSEGNEGI